MSTATTNGGNPSSHPYTCNTCQVAYRNIDLQKGHMKSDWHRYNLKRRVASLPPISAEIFTERVLEARAESTAQADKALFERSCEVCEKTFYSENSYQNHLLSQKHKARVAQGGIQRKTGTDDASSVMSSTFSLGEPLPTKPGCDDEDEVVDSDAEEEFTQVVEGLQKATITENRPSPVKRPSNPTAAIARAHTTPSLDGKERGSSSATPTPSDGDTSVLQQCLFCRYLSPTVRLNAHHMERFHGMFIPEKEYLVDLEGLLEHLNKRIYEECRCLTCGKVKANPFAAQTHMRDVGHCTIPFTTEAEQLDIGEFYDFRGTYTDSDEDDEDEEDEDEMLDGEAKGGARLGARRSEAKGKAREDGEEADDGWETDSSASSFDSEELTAVPVDDRQQQYERLGKNPHHSHTDPRSHRMADGYHSHAHKHGHGAHAVFYDEYELHLPSGKSVGHRQFNKYYRQNLQNYPTAEERAERLAIESGEAGEDGGGDAMDVDGGSQASGTSPQQRPQGRELMLPRGHGGLVGISDQKKEKVRKAVLKSRTAQQVDTKKTDYRQSLVLNNHARYYYRYTRGG